MERSLGGGAAHQDGKFIGKQEVSTLGVLGAAMTKVDQYAANPPRHQGNHDVTRGQSIACCESRLWLSLTHSLFLPQIPFMAYRTESGGWISLSLWPRWSANRGGTPLSGLEAAVLGA